MNYYILLLSVFIVIVICLIIFIITKNEKFSTFNVKNINWLNKDFVKKFKTYTKQQQHPNLYNHKKCQKCKAEIEKTGNKTLYCTHCGSEQYDSMCIPLINLTNIPKDKKPTNCIPKDKYTLAEAQKICQSITKNNMSCSLIGKESELRQDYMNKMCGEDYYCAYDYFDSCSYKYCDLTGDNAYFDPLSKCVCSKPKNKELSSKLPKNVGLICKNEGCPAKSLTSLTRDPLKYQTRSDLIEISNNIPLYKNF
jgi:hypothetical protein